MIQTGRYNDLQILRKTSVGLYVGSEETGDAILLPNKYCPEKHTIGETLNLFVYRDNLERLIATNIKPAIQLYEFAYLKVNSVDKIGAFLDWGMEKDLFVPFGEQKIRMEQGNYYLVFMDIDEKTDRLFASSRIRKHLNNESLLVEEGDQVEILICRQTELGYSVIINNIHEGLIYNNEIFQKIETGCKMKAFVKKIREDNKIDISLSPSGYHKYNDDNAEILLQKLEKEKGFLSLSDKSLPEDIYKALGISKRAFKQALGKLYKEGSVTITDQGIRLN